MSTSFPTSLDAYVRPLLTDQQNSPSHSGVHDNVYDAVEAVQAKVGIDSSAVTTSHDYKLSSVTGTTKASPTDGWIPAGETWVYASADDPTFTFTIAGVDLTTKYYAGMKIKLTQTTAKYFIITKVAFSTDTTITIYGGTDYDLANAAITSPFYSTSRSPAAFPLNPALWSVTVTDSSDRQQASPTQNTWYNLGTTNCQISIPIGVWNVHYEVNAYGVKTGANLTVKTTLSTANNTESDTNLTSAVAGNAIAMAMVSKSKAISVASKTTYYLNALATDASVDNIDFRGDRGDTVIKAISSYL